MALRFLDLRFASWDIVRGETGGEGIWPVTYDGDWRETFRPDIPSVARIYDYLLGGKDNYPVDRAVGESMIVQLPNVRRAVQWNRAFLRRVVRYLISEAGIKQIIDVGAGLPTVGNTHEVALEACPQARVVYVDHDPIVLAHARSMLHGVPGTAVIGRDIIEPGLAWPPEWRPDPGDEVPGNAAESYYCVVVARTN
jgi:hypothetical protein